MKRDKRQFPMSLEAKALILAGRCDRIALADGDAAQALILGVDAAPIPIDLLTPLAEPDPVVADPAQVEMEI